MSAGALDLEGAHVGARLIGQSAGTCDGAVLVVPGDAARSFLVQKLEGNVPADCGDRMPPAGERIDAPLIGCVRAWIDGLSPDAAVADPNACETCGGSSCVDLTSSIEHCGACDQACPSGAACEASACQCPNGLELCDGRCVDLQRDSAHCGQCLKACGSGAVCTGGMCECGPGLESCASGCAEVTSDPANCGMCENNCGPGKLCTPSGCGTQAACAGLTKCGSACVDTTTSFFHCGGCDMPCAAGQECSNGTCGCANGAELCNGACIDTSTDPTHCGTCDTVCPDGTSCTSGACACMDGGSLCGGSCVDLQTSEAHCGTCGRSCAPGQACEAGECACPSVTVSFVDDVAPILERNCTNAGCHTGTKAKASLDLTIANAYAELVNVKATQCNDSRLLVEPGDAAASYLMQKLLGIDLCSGTQMPKAGASLSDGDLEAITAWICQGATK